MNKNDYLKFLFHKTKIDLSRFNIVNADIALINRLFEKLIFSESPLLDLYILSNINELKSIGKYFVFILKKIEENVINFDNLSQNLSVDCEFIENEILNYLSNPKPRKIPALTFPSANITTYNTDYSETDKNEVDPEIEHDNQPDEMETNQEKSDVSNFKKNYLELIQSESEDEDFVFELPKEETFPDGNMENPESRLTEEPDKDDPPGIPFEDESAFQEEDQEIFFSNELVKQPEEIISVKSSDEESSKQPKENSNDDHKSDKGDKIELSSEIQKELDSFEEISEEEEIEDVQETLQTSPTNTVFLEYENEILVNNTYLDKQFEEMITLNSDNSDENKRYTVIKNIIDASSQLEGVSRKMSLEITSNIYQTITLSFEKISDGKYDLSEGTLNLFRKGLTLVTSLIKGDDYFTYKEILKSIENIRNSLIEEKRRKERYLKRLEEKMELEKSLTTKYPEDFQKEKIIILKKLIKDTEQKFLSLEKISGEYQIYEALRSLSGNLNNFKEIVKLANELEFKKLVQLSEASYIFIKFLQNYRINPVTIETKEILAYIIYNLKTVVIGKQAQELDLFISYLNDPVKIFSNTPNKT